VSESITSPLAYRVIPSARVIEELDNLIHRAHGAGHRSQALAALKEIERRLSIYPQFGEKLRDLHQIGQTLWVATVPPFVVRYVIDESIRTVFIGTPFKALPNSGFE
jgi:hypothetical protein